MKEMTREQEKAAVKMLRDKAAYYKRREELQTRISDIIQAQVEHFIGTKETSMHMAEQILKLVEEER